tara:strand:+ start:517 stop:636 length:120 start_codon:yes stop_codon:yes gene_type:complete
MENIIVDISLKPIEDKHQLWQASVDAIGDRASEPDKEKS